MVKRAGDGGQPNPASYLGAGLTWALSTGLFMWLGNVADGRFGTEPWLTLVGAFTGAVAGFWYMYYHLVIEPRERSKRERGGQ